MTIKDVSSRQIRVLIVDDHPVLRHGLMSLLGAHPDITIVAEAENGIQVLPFLEKSETDVLILDIQMKGQSGLDVAHQVRRSHPDVKVIILTTFNEEAHLKEAMEAGVHGFLLKSESHSSLADSIRGVMQGERILSPSLVSNVVGNYQKLVLEQAYRDARLDANDLQILTSISEGASNKDMAEKFYLSEATIKRKVQEIIEKMGAANRTQAIAEAVRRGYI
jgi:DNA-binding NarL/FixJ family response regulator